MKILPLSVLILICCSRLEVDTQGNKKGEPLEFQLNGLRNTIALEMDYKNNILFYADVSEDVIMK